MRRLFVSDRQTVHRVNLTVLRKMASCLLDSLPARQKLRVGVCLVSQSEMARLNEQFLQHEGSTDVLTFDYGQGSGNVVEGEIFISIEDAVIQGRRFRRPWHEETIRYLAHGLLHLSEFDDNTPAARRAMKRQENRLLRTVAEKFPTAQLEKTSDS